MAAASTETLAPLLDLLRVAGRFHRGQPLGDDALAVEVAVTGERWEIEFLADDGINRRL